MDTKQELEKLKSDLERLLQTITNDGYIDEWYYTEAKKLKELVEKFLNPK